jgi:hypothetical protein
LKDIGPSPNLKDIGPSPNLKDIGPSPNLKDIGPSPNLKEIGPSPNLKDTGPSPNLKDIGPSPNLKDIGQSPNQHWVNSSTASRTPAFLQVLTPYEVLCIISAGQICSTLFALSMRHFIPKYNRFLLQLLKFWKENNTRVPPSRHFSTFTLIYYEFPTRLIIHYYVKS